MSTLSTHVLDTSVGRPAQGIHVVLDRDGIILGSGVTDADGRVPALPAARSLPEGEYRLTFDVVHYFKLSGRESFYREIAISFRVGNGDEHYHVPLLLSPFGYSTYRGS
jgi:5-hydroxyisourate hydrolase